MSGTTTLDPTSSPSSTAPAPVQPTDPAVAPSASPAPDPLSATDPTFVVGVDGSLDLSAIVGELANSVRQGDTLTLSSASAANGEVVAGGNGDLIYQPVNFFQQTLSGGPVPGGFSSDTIAYTVTDTAGYSVQGTADITVDPGPIAANGTYVVGHNQTVNLTSYLQSLVTPGMKGDSETISVNSVSGGTVRVDYAAGTPSGGTSAEKIEYTAPSAPQSNVGAGSGYVNAPYELSYTATDQYGDHATARVAITVDPGPTASDPTLTIGHSGTIDLTQLVGQLATPGLSGDTLKLTAASGGTYGGIVTGANGDLLYVGKFAQATDQIGYTVSDQLGDTVNGVANIRLDPGPTAANGTITVGAGQTANVSSYLQSLVTPGLSGDSETFVSLSTQSGRASISGGVTQSETGAGKLTGPQTIDYTAPASGNDTLSYTVVDQNGVQATGTVGVTVDPGPFVNKATTSYVVGHNQTVNLTNYVESLVTPGLSGDTLQLASASAENGQASVAKGALDYTAPASGTDVVDFTVEDQFVSSVVNNGTGGVVTFGTSAPVGGAVAITVDPGPTTSTASASVKLGQSLDLTNTILAADKPGLAGDQLTITADSTLGTLGSVSLVNGDLVYTASGAGLSGLPAGGTAADSFTYTVSDQYGDTAMGTVDLGVTNPNAAPTVINGPPNGWATIQGVDGPEQINAFGYGNTIYANGGSGTIDAGAGQATIYAGGGNLTMNLAGYNNVVTGGDGSDVVSGSQGNSTIALGNGNDQISVGGYSNVIQIGSGNDQIIASGGNNTIAGGGGTDTIDLQGWSNQVGLTGGNNTITGGLGSDTFDLTGGNSSFSLSGQNEVVFLNGANATIDDLGSGLDVKIATGGTEVIQNFASDPSAVIDLLGGVGGYATAAQAFAALTPDGHGGSMLMLGTHGSVDFVGATIQQLHATNFHIG